MAAAPPGMAMATALAQLAWVSLTVMPSMSPAALVYVPSAVQLPVETHVTSLSDALG